MKLFYLKESSETLLLWRVSEKSFTWENLLKQFMLEESSEQVSLRRE